MPRPKPQTLSMAEQQAMAAQNLSAFGGINLQHLRREVAELLGLIGRNGFFDEYTKHDISHIDAMLRILDWLIPDNTKKIMTSADWLMIVLAIYFHDLGLLVTEDEFNQRGNSEFQSFTQDFLFAGQEGTDYRTRILDLYPDDAKRERFLYQEFVRHHHAQRIKVWINGSPETRLGAVGKAAGTISQLLDGLSAEFRRDLGLVCESHHLNDLNDTTKYRVSEPYGNDDNEVVNLQYAAILLRTADLLHITRDRTPSIAFRVISPTNPQSQIEWAKQMSVRSLRSQWGTDRNGATTKDAPRDTIEVHATFESSEAFFGLTSYLVYADAQLRKSNEWIEATNASIRTGYEFPWRYIDDSHVEAKGFLPKPFSFELDKAKILDLLTGHTLYNDTSVVLRELVQNALDAVRFQSLIDGKSAASSGKVRILWDSSSRVLSVTDNGTGMTQGIIEKHLLRVGSSRYDDPEFKRKYPEFSAISRFGIGVLSCFMIADEVDITTIHPDDVQARHISLRTVHGKYLVRLIDKTAEEITNGIGAHGSAVRLKLRPTAILDDVVETARQWIVVPNCEVTVEVDGGDPVRIGYGSPAAALTEAVRSQGYVVVAVQAPNENVEPQQPGKGLVQVFERTIGAVTLAYAAIWNQYFREWEFLEIGSREADIEENEEGVWSNLLGTCIEGIRVERGSPGLARTIIAAIANATGKAAPKTNVARSSLEDTAEKTAIDSAIYAIYASHVAREIESLYQMRNYSVTWATQESRFLLAPLLQVQRNSSNLRQLLEHLLTLPVFLVEREGNREAISANELKREHQFWTSQSELIRSAEYLLKEVAGSASLTHLMQALNSPGLPIPHGLILSDFAPHPLLSEAVFNPKEVVRIDVIRSQRRIDLLWETRQSDSIWALLPQDVIYSSRQYTELLRRGTRVNPSSLLVAKKEIPVHGLDREIGVSTQGKIYLVHGSPLQRYLLPHIEAAASPNASNEQIDTSVILVVTTTAFLSGKINNRVSREEVLNQLARYYHRVPDENWVADYIAVMTGSELDIFNPSRWTREANRSQPNL
jgi:molecular chaperone HtpG